MHRIHPRHEWRGILREFHKIKKLFFNENYSLKNLNKWRHKEELEDLIQNL